MKILHPAIIGCMTSQNPPNCDQRRGMRTDEDGFTGFLRTGGLCGLKDADFCVHLLDYSGEGRGEAVVELGY